VLARSVLLLPTSFVFSLLTRRRPPSNYPDIASSTFGPSVADRVAFSERLYCDSCDLKSRSKKPNDQDIRRATRRPCIIIAAPAITTASQPIFRHPASELEGEQIILPSEKRPDVLRSLPQQHPTPSYKVPPRSVRSSDSLTLQCQHHRTITLLHNDYAKSTTRSTCLPMVP
jgi:hypothetical protein